MVLKAHLNMNILIAKSVINNLKNSTKYFEELLKKYEVELGRYQILVVLIFRNNCVK